MPRCRHCRTLLRRDPEEIGARCPRCQEPLFEQIGSPERVAEGETVSGNLCALHRRNLARGTCQRCGNYFCQVCRTRLRGQTLCIACVERVLENQVATPQDARAHFWQAILAIVFGVAGWGIALLGIIVASAGASSDSIVMIGFGGLIMLVSPVAAIVGAGQGAAAIRARGDHMIIATIGLLLSAFQIAAIIGLFTFSVLLND
jgi:phage FluMu protein Com